MPVTNFTHEIKARMIRLLANGDTADEVAAEIGCEHTHVIAIAKNHGYPDVARLAWAADVMEKNLANPTATPPPAPPRLAPAAPRTNAGSSTTTTTVHGRPDLDGLLRTGKAHQSKRIQNAAQQIIDRLEKLRDLIREDDEKNAARRQAAAERKAAQDEVARLKRALAEAQAKLHPTRAHHDEDTEPSGLDDELACRAPDCIRTFAKSQARSLHETRSHPGFVADVA